MTKETIIQQLKRELKAEKILNQKTYSVAAKAIDLGRYYSRRYHLTRHKLVRAILLIRVLKAENAEFRLNGTGFTNGDSDQF